MTQSIVARLTAWQLRHPVLLLGIVAAVTLVMGALASRLELRTRYEALLPDSQPSVKELARLQARTSSAQTVLVVLEGRDAGALRAMGDRVTQALLALGPDVVSSAQDGVREAQRFLEPRAGLFLERRELESLREQVDARWDWEVAKETGTLLDEDAPSPPMPDATNLEERFRAARKRNGQGDREFPDGFYQDAAGTALVVVATSPIPGGDLDRIGAALARMRSAVDAVRAERPEFAGIRVGWAGDMPTGFAEYGVLRDDLVSVGVAGIAVVLFAVLLYFMRLRALLVMGVTIGISLVWTFGVTELVIGHLNLATAFLVSIIAGNGINIGILYQARYFEERRKGVPARDALRTSVGMTWMPTAIAAVASAAAYGSLLVTDFRAFHDFGFIAALGMLFCWIVKTLVVPPMLLLVDRGAPLGLPATWGWLARVRQTGLEYGKAFAAVVPLAPRAILALFLALAVVGTVCTAKYFARGPMEYDLRKVGNNPKISTDLNRSWDVAHRVLGGSSDSLVILADTPEEGRELAAKLRAGWDAAPDGQKPFVALHSLWSFVPSEQVEKIPTLLALADRLEHAHDRGIIAEQDWVKIARLMPPKDLAPFGIADLPDAIARPFTEKNGIRGTLVVVEPEAGRSEDLHYLSRYADALRETKLDSGKVVHASGRAIVFADALKAVTRDIPRSVALSLAMTLLAVLVTLRRAAHRLSVLLALFIGISGMGAFLYFSGTRLNFLNFAALPVTFGIGVDYSVNVFQRYYADGSKDMLAVLRTTGGAVVLCSLTTMLGYLVLLGSHNLAIRSLGSVAVVGEISCLSAAMLALPSLWLLVERARKSRERRA